MAPAALARVANNRNRRNPPIECRTEAVVNCIASSEVVMLRLVPACLCLPRRSRPREGIEAMVPDTWLDSC